MGQTLLFSWGESRVLVLKRGKSWNRVLNLNCISLCTLAMLYDYLHFCVSALNYACLACNTLPHTANIYTDVQTVI